MWRNILSQALFQIVILSFVLFLGPEIFNLEYSSIDMGIWDEKKGVHYTIFFQIFVFLQVFNEINCRKLKKTEYNVFEGFFNNWLFIIIELGTIIVQIFLVEFGGGFIKVSPLSWSQHLICLAVGSFSIVTGVLIKLLPDALFNKIKLLKEEVMEIKQLDRSLTSRLKRKASSRLNRNN